MEITLNLSEKAVRRLQAFKILSGKTNTDIEQYISEIVEESLAQECAKALDLDQLLTSASLRTPTISSSNIPFQPTEETSIYDNLHFGDADDDDDDGGEYSSKDVEAQVTSTGLKAEDIERDMNVEDPEHEAKAEPNEQFQTEIFGSFEAPRLHNDNDFENPRKLRKKKNYDLGKGKIIPYTGNGE